MARHVDQQKLNAFLSFPFVTFIISGEYNSYAAYRILVKVVRECYNSNNVKFVPGNME